jgi:hypothetical protein
MTKAEIFGTGKWQSISAAEVRAIPRAKLRCVSCHGQVYVTGSYMSGGTYRFTHRRSFPGCGDSIGGEPRRHPNPLF